MNVYKFLVQTCVSGPPIVGFEKLRIYYQDDDHEDRDAQAGDALHLAVFSISPQII